MILNETLYVAFAFLAGALLAWLARERQAVGLQTSLAAAGERIATMQQLDEKLRGQFALLAQGALDSASGRFLELASLKLVPINEEFAKFRVAVDAMKEATAEDLGALKNSLTQVVQLQGSLQDAVRTTNDATGKLRDALQNPRVVGSWGEISLDRVVELGGMTEHCDFDRQTGMRSSAGTMEIPDLTIHLTGGLNIPVDAKASAANYVRAASEPDDEARRKLLQQSAADLRARIGELRGRAYHDIPGYAGMTFMYVPNEAMLSSALALEPSIIDDALNHNIVVCSPLLLLCYLRAFARGWSLQERKENAEEIARRGKMLHDRLQSFFAVVGKIGRRLNLTVQTFNDAVGKMDNLLVPGRELGKMLATDRRLDSVDPLGTVARDVPFTAANESAALPGDSATEGDR